MQNYLNVPIFGYGLSIPGTTANQGTLEVATKYVYAMGVPSDAFGGGLTVTDFKVYTQGTVATNTMNIALVTMSAANAVNGTVYNIASAAQYGGTSFLKSGTVVTSSWVDADDSHSFLAIEIKQVTALAVGTTLMNACFGYQQGRG